MAQIKGLELGLQSLRNVSRGSVTVDEARILDVLKEQKAALEDCVIMCVQASQRATAASGNTIRLAKAMDHARQLVGTIGHVEEGGPALTIESLLAEGESRQMAGTIEGDIALKFMMS